MRLVITGIGVLSPAGIGKEAFRSSVFSGACASLPSRVSRFTREIHGFEVKGLDFESRFPDRRFRRASLTTKFALVSAREALADAGLIGSPGCLDGLSVGIASGVTHGSLAYSCDFHRAIVTEGGASASPALFSDSVLNASTGSISLAFSARGPAHTLIGGSAVGLQAIGLGAGLVRSGAVRVCIVSCAEVMEEISSSAYALFSSLKKSQGLEPVFVAGEGAGALVIESLEDATARGARPVAEIAGWGFRTAGPVDVGLAGAVAAALKSSGVDRGEVRHIISGASSGPSDFDEAHGLGRIIAHAANVASLKGYIGEGFGAASLMSSIAGALSLATGEFPKDSGYVKGRPYWSWAGAEPSGSPENCLITACGPTKEAGALILKKV